MEIQRLILLDTYTTFQKYVLMKIIIQKVNSKSYILLNAIGFLNYNYWDEKFWKHYQFSMLGPIILVEWKMLRIKTTPVLISDLYLNVRMGKKNWWAYIECEITYSNTINIWEMQAKTLRNIIGSCIKYMSFKYRCTTSVLLFKSAKKKKLICATYGNESSRIWVSMINTHS